MLDLLKDASEEALLLVSLFGDAEEDGDESAILLLSYGVATYANDLGLASFKVLFEVLVVEFSVRGRHEHADVLSNDFDERVSEEVLGRLVEAVDGTSLVDDDGGHSESVEDLAFLLDERLFLRLSLRFLHDANEEDLAGSGGLFGDF